MTAEERPQLLIVDDLLSNRQVLSGMLVHLGCHCEHVETGFEALELVEQGRRFDIIFMDLQMPEIDGFETTRRLRKLVAHHDRHQVILAISAAPNPEHRQRAFAAGVDDFLAKPIGLRTLRKTLTLWCENAPTEASVAKPSPSLRLPRAVTLDLKKIADSPDFDVNVLTGLEALAADGVQLQAEVVGLLLAQIPDKRRAVVDACAWGDGEMLRQVAHSLGGGARNVGATAVALVCDDLQNFLEKDSSPTGVEDVKPLVEVLLGALDRAVLVLGAAIGERG